MAQKDNFDEQSFGGDDVAADLIDAQLVQKSLCDDEIIANCELVQDLDDSNLDQNKPEGYTVYNFILIFIVELI